MGFTVHKTLFSGSTEPAAEPPPPRGPRQLRTPCLNTPPAHRCPVPLHPSRFRGPPPMSSRLPDSTIGTQAASRAVSPAELSLRRHLLGTQTPGCRLEGPPPACPHQGALPSSWGPDYALVMSGSEWPEKVAVPGPHACPTDLRAASASSWGSVRIIQGPAGHEL